MPSRTDTGEAKEYTDAEVDELVDAMESAMADYEATLEDVAGAEPSRADVEAIIEWAGSVQRSNGGFRRTRLEGLDPDRMRAVREALDRARTAKPSVRYDRKGWHAQLKQLTGTERGRDAADRAGLSPTSRTLHGWLAKDHTPNAANQRRISAAYENLRNWQVDSARRAAADRFSEALEERYGAEIRLRGIDHLDFEP